jgi:heat-inducible transcriptional repressor
LDQRKAAILRAVVEEYIETAQPVGSQHVARAQGVQVSSATIRNEMAVLERDGYLVQPHTSAGRIPTDKGYRFFVDTLPVEIGSGVLAPAQRQQVRDFFKQRHGELEEILRDTSQLLTRLTHHTAVVVGPPHPPATVRSLQLVGLNPRVALLVAVLNNGAVEKRTVELPMGPDGEGPADTTLATAGLHLARLLDGRTLAEPPPAPATGDAGVDAVMRSGLAALHQPAAPETDHLFVGGASRMAAAFDAVATVREVLAILEKEYVVVTLVRDVLERGLSVAIGESEHGMVSLAECSLVVAPYLLEGAPAGSIAVLGPTRMNYPQALAAVAVVSQRLGRALGQN